ncbi:alpha/beta fold hydrolase [Pseudomonas zeae]|uniref:alpha/beta fold hydrolase n=1 Tax=Pseudomonas zeae TaxID=2745510 RepID=UPI0039E1E290
MLQTLFTSSGVRLRPHSTRPGTLNWLLLPGGPRLGSESLEELANILCVPGTVWLVDLPEDGSNRRPPGRATSFSNWPHVVIEAAQALTNVIFVGHSTGGMYLLSVPALESEIIGLALIGSAPDASWQEHFASMVSAHPLPAVDKANAQYEADRCDAHLAAIAVAAAEWNFTSAGLSTGRGMLERLPYNREVEWSENNFDRVYTAQWWPNALPVLIMAGSDDRIVDQRRWQQSRFKSPNVSTALIDGAGHFPWIENPDAVQKAFSELAYRVEVNEASRENICSTVSVDVTS